MRRTLILSLAFAGFACGVAEAGRLPGPTRNFGPNCHAISRATGQTILFVGTVLGGRTTAHRWGGGTMTDYRTLQGCFVSEMQCQNWITGHAQRYARQPGYARCTQVHVGLRP